jgi:5,10-methylenetetrahydromethanopterin reductase
MATFSIRFLDHLAPARTLVDWAVLAEEKGFDACWFPHDTFRKHSWILGAAVAENTRRMMIGSVGTNPYTFDPSEIATYIATLDELSGGRAALGLGMHTGEMVAWLGMEPRDMITRTREAVQIVRSLLRGDVVAYEGSEFRWTEQCYLRFAPLRADVPIYPCGFGEEYLAMTGEVGDGSLPMITPPDSAPRMVAAINKGVERSGRTPGSIDIAGCGWFSVSDDLEAAKATIRPVVAYFGPYLEEEALNTVGVSVKDFDPIKERLAVGDYAGAESLLTDDMLRLAVVGTPKEVIPRVEALLEAGITQVSVGGPLGPDVARAIELLGDEVLPYFRSAAS